MLPLLAYWQRVIAILFILIGYARVSKLDRQDTRTQVKELKRVGCKRIFEESASGGRWDRPELHRALDQLREGDVLIHSVSIQAHRFAFWRQPRFGQSALV